MARADGEHAGAQAVLVAVVFPHGDEVFGADNERFEALVILKDAGDGGGHQGFAETDDIADEDAAAFVEMVGGDLDGGGLKVKQGIAEVGGDAEFGEAGARLLGEVVGDLDVDMVGVESVPRTRQLSSMMAASSLEMSMHQLSFQRCSNQSASLLQASWSRTSTFSSPLFGEAGLGEVAAAQVADDGIDGIGAVQQVELGMKRVGEKKLDDYLAGLELL